MLLLIVLNERCLYSTDVLHKDTLVQGWERRSLEDPWASAQMWIVIQIEGTTDYMIRNAAGRTCIDLPDRTYIIRVTHALH